MYHPKTGSSVVPHIILRQIFTCNRFNLAAENFICLTHPRKNARDTFTLDVMAVKCRFISECYQAFAAHNRSIQSKQYGSWILGHGVYMFSCFYHTHLHIYCKNDSITTRVKNEFSCHLFGQ